MPNNARRPQSRRPAPKSIPSKRTRTQSSQGTNSDTGQHLHVERHVSLTPSFKIVLIITTLFTFISLAGYISLSLIFPENNPNLRVDDVIETLKYSFTSGFAAFFGLLGGKVL